MPDQRDGGTRFTLAFLSGLFLATLVAALWGAHPAHGQQVAGTGLVISPPRLEFGPRERQATIYVMNGGSRAATYRLELVDLIPTDEGEDGRRFVRFAPRRVRLAAGETQVVRILIRSAPPGRYVARLRIQALPPLRQGRPPAPAAASS